MKNNEDIINELINGSENTTEVQFEGLSQPLTLRPLTNGELLILKKLEKGSQKGKIKVQRGMTREEIEDQVQDLECDIVYKDIVENESKTKYRAIEFSTGLKESLN